MAERGAQPGNDNATKNRPWADAIRYALAERERTGKPGTLRDLASTMIDKALDGDMNALKELGDRLEGKPAQAIIGGAEDDPPIKQSLTVAFKGLPDAGR